MAVADLATGGANAPTGARKTRNMQVKIFMAMSVKISSERVYSEDDTVVIELVLGNMKYEL